MAHPSTFTPTSAERGQTASLSLPGTHSGHVAMPVMRDRVGCAALLALLLPLMAVSALAVLLTSPGPITTRSAEVAGRGRVVLLHRFRTTYHESRFRVATPVGRFLRFSGIAGLPMLVDVWKGRIGLRDALRR